MTEFHWPVRVYYEDTDSGGVVYYANYLKFMERARTEWLRSLGFEQDELREKEGVLFAVHKVAVEYKRPARFNDALIVSAKIKAWGRASLTFQQEVISEMDRQVLCVGEIQIACVSDGRFRPTPIPKALLAELTNAI